MRVHGEAVEQPVNLDLRAKSPNQSRLAAIDPKRRSGMTALETVAFRVADPSASTLPPVWIMGG